MRYYIRLYANPMQKSGGREMIFSAYNEKISGQTSLITLAQSSSSS